MISQGCSRILKEKLNDVSDPFEMPVCNICGNPTHQVNNCTVCNTNDVSMVNIPYATKLLFQMFNAMGMKLKINT